MPTATDDGGGRSMGRRTFLRGVGATAAAGAGLAYSDGPIGNAEALGPTLFGGATGVTVARWLIEEVNPFGASSPDSGLTPSALKQQVYQTAKTRKSTNASTMVDNRNMIEMGLPNALYVEGKLAAIEKLNQQAAKADVESAAHDAMAKYATTIEKNLLKSFNETVAEVLSLITTTQSHPDVGIQDLFGQYNGGAVDSSQTMVTSTPESNFTLSDGSTFSVSEAPGFDASGYSSSYDPLRDNSGNSWGVAVTTSSGDVYYLKEDDWRPLWNDLQNTISNVESGLTTWVNNVYDQVQAGSIEISELITPRERSQMIAEEDGAAQAIADLQALNVPVDVDNQATVSFSSTNATLRGTLAMTNPEGQTLEPGTSYNPSSDTWSGGSLYLTYDVSTGQGDWNAFTEGVDGGVAKFGEEPYENTTYRIDTSANETVSVNSGNFTPVNSSGAEVPETDATAWQIDLSEKLEQDITNITDVSFFSPVEETQMETIQIDEAFTLEEIRNTETDETKDSMTFENSGEPQTDNNYITQEEWTELQNQNEELIEKYEESQESNDGLLGGLLPGGLGSAGIGAAAGGVLVVGLGIGGLKKALDFYLPGR